MANELEFIRVDDAEIATALAGLPGWTRDGKRIVKTFIHDSFPAAIEFVNRVAAVAERFNHHPDIEIHYKTVVIAFRTHKTDGITRADLVLAGAVEEITR